MGSLPVNPRSVPADAQTQASPPAVPRGCTIRLAAYSYKISQLLERTNDSIRTCHQLATSGADLAPPDVSPPPTHRAKYRQACPGETNLTAIPAGEAGFCLE